ncbi:MAG: hypothetical protein ACI8S6_002728, partial [Myxococcota bacterium]
RSICRCWSPLELSIDKSQGTLDVALPHPGRDLGTDQLP